MKGLAIIGKDHVEWQEKEKPAVGKRDVLCSPVAVTPCTTDVHQVKYYSESGIMKKGTFLGHEAVGKIVEAGEEVKKFKVGDIVVVPSVTPEWDGWEIQDGLSKFSNGNAYLFTMAKDGVFAEYFHVNDADHNLALLPEGVSPEEGVMAVDMLATACAGVERAGIKFGDSVVVFGIGPVGLLSIAAAKSKGAGKIAALGTKKECIELAHFYGAQNVFDYHDVDVKEQIIEWNNHRPVDVVITAGGNSDVVSKALSIVKLGGAVSNVAGFFDREVSFATSIDEWYMGTGDKAIYGTMVPGGGRYMERMLSLISSGRVDVKPLIKPVLYGFDEIPRALQLMSDKSEGVIKPVVLLEG